VSIAWFRRHFPEVEITPEQDACCRYLEQRGKRFAVDFGYQSAPGMVWDEIDAEIEGRGMIAPARWLD
jgi:hypothetical protein